MKGDRERFLRAGMNGYLSKPLVEADLVNLLMSNCNHYSMDDENHQDAAAESSSGQAADDFFAQAPDAEVLDLEGFYALLGGNQEVAIDLLEQFTTYAFEPFDEGEEALKANDLETARSRFHKLAGSAATICAHQLRAYSLRL